MNTNSKNNDLRSNIRELLNSENKKSSQDSSPPKTVTVLSCLLSVQDNFHYIPDEAIEEIADFMDKTINDVCKEATLTIPENSFMTTGGREGIHTEHLGHLLSDMQYLQRAYPDAKW